MTDSGKEVVRIFYINYLVYFQEEKVKALLDVSSKINTMNPNFAWKLSLHIQITNIRTQKLIILP